MVLTLPKYLPILGRELYRRINTQKQIFSYLIIIMDLILLKTKTKAKTYFMIIKFVLLYRILRELLFFPIDFYLLITILIINKILGRYIFHLQVILHYFNFNRMHIIFCIFSE